MFDLGVEGEADANVRAEDVSVCYVEAVVEIFASLLEEKAAEDEEKTDELSVDCSPGRGDLLDVRSESE